MIKSQISRNFILILSYLFKQLSHRVVLCFELRAKTNGLLVKIVVPLFSISSLILNAETRKTLMKHSSFLFPIIT